MANPIKQFHPGTILHDVIIGAFRSAGTNLDTWCQKNGTNSVAARSVTLGMSCGPKGTILLNKIIDAAGRDIVTASYRKRMLIEAEKLKESAAA